MQLVWAIDEIYSISISNRAYSVRTLEPRGEICRIPIFVNSCLLAEPYSFTAASRSSTSRSASCTLHYVLISLKSDEISKKYERISESRPREIGHSFGITQTHSAGNPLEIQNGSCRDSTETNRVLWISNQAVRGDASENIGL